MELDFGAVRVGEVAERKFSIVNTGLYDVTFKFLLKTKAYRERFMINEMQGILKTGEEKSITVRFKSKSYWEQKNPCRYSRNRSSKLWRIKVELNVRLLQ